MTTGTLHGRIALVTGGSRGIGAAIVRSLAQVGAAVAVNYRERASEANALVKAINDAGGHAIAIAADVSQADAVAQMVQRVKSDLGPIDILINNAGRISILCAWLSATIYRNLQPSEILQPR